MAFKLEELQHQCPPSADFRFSVLLLFESGEVNEGMGFFFFKKSCTPGEMQYLNVRVRY